MQRDRILDGITPDKFQERAMDAIDRGSDLLLTAHTGSGKSLVAEYAMARRSRALYVCPNKALCNQRFIRHGGGVHTGDFCVDTGSAVVSVTLEIFCHVKELSDGLETIVFDEAHCYSDNSRGALFEIAVATLPAEVQLVMISASMGSEALVWLNRLRQNVEHVSNPERVVPLHFSVYYGLGTFKNLGDDSWTHNHANNPKCYPTLVAELRESDRLPAIIFFFSMRLCDTEARGLGDTDLIRDPEEKDAVERAITAIKPNFLNENMKQQLEMIRRGVAVHHSGCAPVMRQLVEGLARAGLVKLVLATETLAVGMDLPIRTVILDTLEKVRDHGWDRLTSEEFMQMAGRAGRRGRDVCGYAVLVCRRKHWHTSTLRAVIANTQRLNFPFDKDMFALFCADRDLHPGYVSERLLHPPNELPPAPEPWLYSDRGLTPLGLLALGHGVDVARCVNECNFPDTPVHCAIALSAYVTPWRSPIPELGRLVALFPGTIRAQSWQDDVTCCLFEWLETFSVGCIRVREGTFIKALRGTAALCSAVAKAAPNALRSKLESVDFGLELFSDNAY